LSISIYCIAAATILVRILFEARTGAAFAVKGGISVVALTGESGAFREEGVDVGLAGRGNRCLFSRRRESRCGLSRERESRCGLMKT
jgi:hypothetical protein